MDTTLPGPGYQDVERFQPRRILFSATTLGDSDSESKSSSRAVSPSGRTAGDSATQRPLKITEDASIVFIGPRGNGKSSLAVIAGLLLRRQVIDADTHFTTTTGLTKSAYKRKFGLEACRVQEFESTESLLTRYEKNCVIACGPSIAREQCRPFMTEYRKAHPIIYVARPVQDIEDYLRFKDKGKMRQWIQSIHASYRRISNLEFFNLPETWKDDNLPCLGLERFRSVLPHRLESHDKFQTLQKTRSALARFLAAALGHSPSSLTHTIFPTLYPSRPEQRIYSNALCISLSSLISEEVDISQVPNGADAVELVLDARESRCKELMSSGSVGQFVAEIRRFLAVPIIYHLHMTNIGESEWNVYFDLLYQGLRLAPEYMTVQLDAPHTVINLLNKRKGYTRIIGHQENNTPECRYWLSPEPLKVYERALSLGCSMVRLVRHCDSMADNFWCMTFVDKIEKIPNKVPIIAYNTGDMGRLSRVCNPTLTPVLPSSSLNADSATDMTISERMSTLFAIHALSSLRFFVVGGAVRNSLSPAMHNAAFQALGMPHIYSVQEATSVEELRTLFSDSNFGGASVSLPFKKTILTIVKKLSPSAELIGAANTIIPIRKHEDVNTSSDSRGKEYRHRSGPISMLYGDNTDWIGICACVSRSISPANYVNRDTASLVIGAGGMARAAVYCLLYLGVRNICIYNRTVSHAQALARYYEQVFVNFAQSKSHYSPQIRENGQLKGLRIRVLESMDSPWPDDFNQPSIVICAIKAYNPERDTTPPFVMPKAWMRNNTGGIVVELAYHTRETPLMRQLREENHSGWTVVDPIEVLFEQACAQWELFTGNHAPRKAMWEACLDRYAEKVENHDYDHM